MYKIDYSSMLTSVPSITSTPAVYNESIGRRIDRKVQRRVTEKDPTKSTGIRVAGPFGSLKKYTTLNTPRPIWDSFVPEAFSGTRGYCPNHSHSSKEECNAFVGAEHPEAGSTGKSDVWVDAQFGTLLQQLPEGFPFETNSEARKRDVDPISYRVKMNTTGTGGPTSEGDVSNNEPFNSETVIYSSKDTNGNSYSWGTQTTSAAMFTEGEEGLINITNYIDDEFKDTGDFRKKTVRDLLLGFGDGIKGKHTIRPLIFPYKAISSTGEDSFEFAGEYRIDPPRGARFGLYSVGPTRGSYKFSSVRYGMLRDMFEQAVDTRFLGREADEESYGAPVVINPINPVNPTVPKLMENTSRYNKTTDATITVPYIESNYEATSNPPNLNSESLRVDVAGSIRTRAALAPGNVAANIRRRG